MSHCRRLRAPRPNTKIKSPKSRKKVSGWKKNHCPRPRKKVWIKKSTFFYKAPQKKWGFLTQTALFRDRLKGGFLIPKPSSRNFGGGSQLAVEIVFFSCLWKPNSKWTPKTTQKKNHWVGLVSRALKRSLNTQNILKVAARPDAPWWPQARVATDPLLNVGANNPQPKNRSAWAERKSQCMNDPMSRHKALTIHTPQIRRGGGGINNPFSCNNTSGRSTPQIQGWGD